MPWPVATPIETTRFLLEPLAVEHAVEMVDVLAPAALYAFTGGEPPTLERLRERYARQVLGHSPDASAGWLNWTIRLTATRAAIGFVQATLSVEDNELVAELAWLITPPAQGTGAAAESAAGMLAWLTGHRVRVARALISPGHEASAHLARRLGLAPTPVTIDGETLWQSRLTDAPLPTPRHPGAASD